MKKQFLVLLMLGAFVSQVQGAEQSNQTAIVSSLQNYLDFVNRDDITPLLASAQVVKRKQLMTAFNKLKDNLLDADGKGRLIANLTDFSEVVSGLLKPKATRDVGKLTQRQLEEAEVARKREAEFARLAQEAQDALENKRKTAEEERVTAEKAAKEEAERAAKAEKTRKAQEQLAIKKVEKAERLRKEEEARIELARIAAEELRLEQERLEQLRIAEELRLAELARIELARLEALRLEQVRVAQEQEALRIAEEQRVERERIAQLEQAAAMERERLAELAEQQRLEEARIAAEERIIALELAEALEKERLEELTRVEAAEKDRLIRLEKAKVAEERRLEQERLAGLELQETLRKQQLEALEKKELEEERMLELTRAQERATAQQAAEMEKLANMAKALFERHPDCTIRCRGCVAPWNQCSSLLNDPVRYLMAYEPNGNEIPLTSDAKMKLAQGAQTNAQPVVSGTAAAALPTMSGATAKKAAEALAKETEEARIKAAALVAAQEAEKKAQAALAQLQAGDAEAEQAERLEEEAVALLDKQMALEALAEEEAAAALLDEQMALEAAAEVALAPVIAREALMAQIVLAQESVKDTGAGLAAGMILIPGFEDLDTDFQKWLQPTQWKPNTIQYFISLIASNLAIDYLFGSKDADNRDEIKLGDGRLSIDRARNDFGRTQVGMEAVSQIPKTPALSAFPQEGNRLKLEAVEAIFNLNNAFKNRLDLQKPEVAELIVNLLAGKVTLLSEVERLLGDQDELVRKLEILGLSQEQKTQILGTIQLLLKAEKQSLKDAKKTSVARSNGGGAAATSWHDDKPSLKYTQGTIAFVTKVYQDLVLAENSQDFKVRENMPKMREMLAGYARQNRKDLDLTQDQIKDILEVNSLAADSEQALRVFKMIQELLVR